MSRSSMAAALALTLALVSLLPSAQAGSQDDLIYHSIKTDEDGKIIPWRSRNLGEAYDHNIRLVWNFWKNHYLRAMAAAPELAPDDQNHLLRTSSVVKNISYGPDAITYTKFDERSSERFRLGEWEPGSIQGGEMTWDRSTKVLEVRAARKTVTISRH